MVDINVLTLKDDVRKTYTILLLLSISFYVVLFVIKPNISLNIGNASVQNNQLYFIAKSSTSAKILKYINKSYITCKEKTYCVKLSTDNSFQIDIPVTFNLCPQTEILDQCHEYPLHVEVDTASWIKLGVVRR